MKKYILTTICLLAFTFGNAQSFEVKRANKLFDKRSYLDAANLYATAKQDKEVLQKLGDCYYFNTHMKDAVETYEKLFKKYEGIDAEYYYKYSQALKGIEKYEQADEWMKKYEALSYDRSSNDLITELEENSYWSYIVDKSSINSSFSDFGPMYVGSDKVVFASSRNDGKEYKWNNQPYLDLFSADLSEEGKLSNVTELKGEANTITHESNAVITQDGNTMYFSRTNFESGKPKYNKDGKVANIKIYKATLDGEEWTNIEELPFNSDDYSVEHPALNADETKLYFASDMPGTIGSLDLFEVDINSDGSFSTPKNLGPTINTVQREQFPYMSNDDKLYFASNGHLGLGGLDIFKSDYNGSFAEPVNLGLNINSSEDDFGFIIKEEENKGFLSSNRDTKGNDNIYRFEREVRVKPEFWVDGVVIDRNSEELLPGSLVTLFDGDNMVIQDTIVKKDAYFIFKIEADKKYKIRGTRNFYIPSDIEFSTDSEGKISRNIKLELDLEDYADGYSSENVNIVKHGTDDYELVVEPIYFDFDKWDIRRDASEILDNIVEVMNEFKEMEIEIRSHTDSRGNDEYNLILSNKRAKSTLEYLVSQGIERSRLRAAGFGENQPVNPCGNNCTEAQHDKNRRSEFKLTK